MWFVSLTLSRKKELFLWSLEQKSETSEKGENDGGDTVERLEESKRNFEELRKDPELMKAIFGVPKESRVKVLVAKLGAETALADRVEALEELEEIAEDIEEANGLDKCGGLETVIGQSLASEDAGERAAACAVLAAVARNNPTGQVAIVNRQGMQPLMALLRSETRPHVLLKIVSAISAVVQHQPNALLIAYHQGALAVMGRILHLGGEDVKAVKARILFMCCALMDQRASLDILEDSGLMGFCLLHPGESVERLVQGLHCYHKVDAKRLLERHGPALIELSKMIAPGDEETKTLFNHLMKPTASGSSSEPIPLLGN